MKIFALFLLLAACSTPDRKPAGQSEIPPLNPRVFNPFIGPATVNVPGANRAGAKLYLPLDFAKKEQWPLVVLLHGLGGTADVQDQYLTMRYRVSARGFILLVPEGTTMPKGVKTPNGDDLSGKQFWNATDECCDFGNTKVNDVAFLSSLIAMVKEKYNVDPARVYLFGHSNGGYMANRLACEGLGLAGIASLAGGSFLDPSKCRLPVATPFLQIHAVDDGTIPYAPTPGVTGARDTITQWLTKNKCSGTARKGSRPDYVILVPGPDTEGETWDKCESGKPVALWTIRPHVADGHNAHVPYFHLNFTDDVLNFLLNAP